MPLTLTPISAYSEVSLQDSSEDYIINFVELCKECAEEGD
jgi:hypothetical protein